MCETASLPFDCTPSPSSTLPSKVALNTTEAMSLVPARQVNNRFSGASSSLMDFVVGKRALPINNDSEVASDMPPQASPKRQKRSWWPPFLILGVFMRIRSGSFTLLQQSASSHSVGPAFFISQSFHFRLSCCTLLLILQYSIKHLPIAHCHCTSTSVSAFVYYNLLGSHSEYPSLNLCTR